MLNKISLFFNRLRGRQFEGTDPHGNKFFTKREEGKIRRIVDYNGQIDPSSIHPLWKSWLNFTREKAPSSNELQLWEKEQEELKRKVKKIKDADTKIRLADIAQRQRIVSNDDDDFLNYQKDLRTIYKGDMKRLGNGD